MAERMATVDALLVASGVPEEQLGFREKEREYNSKQLESTGRLWRGVVPAGRRVCRGDGDERPSIAFVCVHMPRL